MHSLFPKWTVVQMWYVNAFRLTKLMRWYPWGIQQLVSTYSNRHWLGGGWSGKGQIWTQERKSEFWKFGVGGGGDLESQNPKCQDLPKFQFLGGGVIWKVKTQSAKIRLNFNFWEGGGSGTKFQIRGKLSNLVKNFWKPSLPLHHR